MKPTIAITMGDPLGIGAEIIIKSLPKFRERVRFKVFGDPGLLQDLLMEEIVPVTVESEGERWTPLSAGRASVAYLDAFFDQYEQGACRTLVTAPISKSHVNLAGFPFPGHTEYLAAKTGSSTYTMMMAAPGFRVSLVTIHEPLSGVAAVLSHEKILQTIETTYTSLQEKFHIETPRLAVCGLNPHAGEGGLLGKEETDMIRPAIEAANEKGYVCSGPVVPDAVFHEIYEGQWDAVVCMYHDQGLIPFKMVHFKDGVNVTLGLPLVRTSPDHGTASDIAGKGIADSTSMEAAIAMAIEMTQ